ncbi:hypothetical protein ACEWAY_23345, partial [Vibrio parahaemolyticus]
MKNDAGLRVSRNDIRINYMTGAVRDGNAIAAIGQGSGASSIGADEIELEGDTGCGPLDQDAILT